MECHPTVMTSKYNFSSASNLNVANKLRHFNLILLTPKVIKYTDTAPTNKRATKDIATDAI